MDLLSSAIPYYLGYLGCILLRTSIDINNSHSIICSKLKVNIRIVLDTFFAFINPHFNPFGNSFENFWGLEMEHYPKNWKCLSFLVSNRSRRLEHFTLFFKGITVGQGVYMLDFLPKGLEIGRQFFWGSLNHLDLWWQLRN